MGNVHVPRFAENTVFTSAVGRRLAQRFPAYAENWGLNASVPADALNWRELPVSACAAVLRRAEADQAAAWAKTRSDKRELPTKAVLDSFELMLEDQRAFCSKSYPQDLSKQLLQDRRLADLAKLPLVKRCGANAALDFMVHDPVVSDDEWYQLVLFLAKSHQYDQRLQASMLNRPHMTARLVESGDPALMALACVLDLPTELADAAAARLVADKVVNGDGSTALIPVLEQASLSDKERAAVWDLVKGTPRESTFDNDGLARVGSVFAPGTQLSKLDDPKLVELFAQRGNDQGWARGFRRLAVLASPAVSLPVVNYVVHTTKSYHLGPGSVRYLEQAAATLEVSVASISNTKGYGYSYGPHLAERHRYAEETDRIVAARTESKRTEACTNRFDTAEQEVLKRDAATIEHHGGATVDSTFNRWMGQNGRFVGAYLRLKFGPGETEKELQYYETFTSMLLSAPADRTIPQLADAALKLYR